MSEVVSKDIPRVRSPYEGQTLDTKTQIAISAYWFATNFLWGALLVNMLPDEVKALAPTSRVLALAFLTGLSAIIALVVPLVAGALSDRCAHPWGRRRPYMAVGMTINVAGLLLMATAFANRGLATEGSFFANPAFLAFFFAFMVVQFGNNVTSAAYSGIIPDLVPENQRGAASGYMALMSQLGTLFGAFASGLLLRGSGETAKYLVLCLVLVLVGGITLAGIRENPLPEKPPAHPMGHLPEKPLDRPAPAP